MLSLITGGSASGKSAFAERLAACLGEERIYLATMEAAGPEAAARIARHRRNRAGRGFRTVEKSTGLETLQLPSGATVLLEDLGNLLANEMYSQEGRGASAVRDSLRALAGSCSHLTVVTNEVTSGGTDYAGDTLRYMRELARLNRLLAAEADLVCEIVCGMPNILKGELPCGF